ncbi:MAG: type II secretion system protein GspE, partial [Deltaproteobacteria bacterium]
IYEVLEIKPEIRDLILQFNSPGLIKNKAIEMGMTTLFQSGIRKVLQGLTTIEEVMRICTDED